MLLIAHSLFKSIVVARYLHALLNYIQLYICIFFFKMCVSVYIPGMQYYYFLLFIYRSVRLLLFLKTITATFVFYFANAFLRLLPRAHHIFLHFGYTIIYFSKHQSTVPYFTNHLFIFSNCESFSLAHSVLTFPVVFSALSPVLLNVAGYFVNNIYLPAPIYYRFHSCSYTPTFFISFYLCSLYVFIFILVTILCFFVYRYVAHICLSYVQLCRLYLI